MHHGVVSDYAVNSLIDKGRVYKEVNFGEPDSIHFVFSLYVPLMTPHFPQDSLQPSPTNHHLVLFVRFLGIVFIVIRANLAKV